MFYVYAWYNVETKFIFYVGKGCGNRYRQVRNRNELFQKYYKSHKCSVKIIKRFVNEQDAFKYEERHIKRLKRIGQCICNLDNGGRGGVNFIWTEEMRRYKSEYNPMKDSNQRKRMSRNNPMKNPEVSKRVADKNRKRPIINNVLYDSLEDASENYGVHPVTISKWCKRGYDTEFNPCHYLGEEQKEFKKKVTNSKSVIIDGRKFDSVKDAARYYNTYSESIIRAIKAGRKFKGMSCEYGDQ